VDNNVTDTKIVSLSASKLTGTITPSDSTVTETKLNLSAGSVSGTKITDNTITDTKIISISASKITGTVSSSVSVDTAIGTSDISTTSTSYADMTNMSITNTLAAGNVNITFNAPIYAPTYASAAPVIFIQIVVDSVSKIILSNSHITETPYFLSWTGYLSAGSHTIKIQWKQSSTGAGNAIVYQNGTTDGYRYLTVISGLN
jgi:hypothetical protein